MIWNPERNSRQGLIVTELYQAAGAVPCERLAVIAGGLPGAGKAAVLAAAGIDRDRYLTVGVGAVLEVMAAAGLVPVVAGLSPMEAAGLAHAEAQHIAKRVALRSLADGRNLILDVSLASALSVMSWIAALRSAGYAARGVFAELGVEESVRRADAAHRRGEEEYRRGRGHGGRYVPADAIRALARAAGPDDWASAAAPEQDVWFLGGQVTALIDAWRAGRITLADLARQFSARTWPAVPPVCPPDMATARAAVDDLEPYLPGSFDDVVVAYDLGQLSDAEYGPLAGAAAAGVPARASDQ